jgi:hypothetical protein
MNDYVVVIIIIIIKVYGFGDIDILKVYCGFNCGVKYFTDIACVNKLLKVFDIFWDLKGIMSLCCGVYQIFNLIFEVWIF